VTTREFVRDVCMLIPCLLPAGFLAAASIVGIIRESIIVDEVEDIIADRENRG